jgi:hypothetical protein
MGSTLRTGLGSTGGGTKAARTALLGLLALSLVSADDGGVKNTYYTCSLPDGRILMRETPCPRGAKTLSAREVVDKPRPAPSAEGQPRAAPDSAGTTEGATSDPGVGDQPFVDPSFDAGLLRMMMLRARLMKVVASLNSLKTSVMMYNAETGQWPTKASELGLDPKTMYTDEIKDVRFEGDGTIVAELTPGFGESKRIALQPRWTLGGAQLEWECLANFPEKLFNGMGAPPCKSRAIASAAR